MHYRNYRIIIKFKFNLRKVGGQFVRNADVAANGTNRLIPSMKSRLKLTFSCANFAITLLHDAVDIPNFPVAWCSFVILRTVCANADDVPGLPRNIFDTF